MGRSISVRCARCGREVFKYLKIGEGRLWHCWKSRIIKDYSVRKENEIRCQCGNLIGIDEGIYIKLKRSSYTW